MLAHHQYEHTALDPHSKYNTTHERRIRTYENDQIEWAVWQPCRRYVEAKKKRRRRGKKTLLET